MTTVIEGVWQLGVTPLVKARFIYKPLKIDTELEFIVDTGNSATLIGHKSAKEMKIDYNLLPNKGTANGIPCKVSGACRIEFNKDIGFDLLGVRILEEVPGHYPDNLIGMDILRYFKIGFTDTKVVLHHNNEFPANPF